MIVDTQQTYEPEEAGQTGTIEGVTIQLFYAVKDIYVCMYI